MIDGLGGILETALYYRSADREKVLAFYEGTLAMRKVAEWPNGRAYRLGPGVLLLFDLDLLAEQEGPVSDHGAGGPGHLCLLAGPDRFAAVRAGLLAAGVEITHDHEWPRGGRSFYFKDPAGNLLEIADSDLWPG